MNNEDQIKLGINSELVSAVKAGNEISFDDDISSEIHIQPTTGTSSSNSMMK